MFHFVECLGSKLQFFVFQSVAAKITCFQEQLNRLVVPGTLFRQQNQHTSATTAGG